MLKRMGACNVYTLLIVDDEVFIANKVKSSLNWELLGFSQVLVAYNIRQAKELFEAHSIDIMICDIEMPQGNGLELLAWVRERYNKTETIFLTCHADFEYSKQAIKLGSFDYLLKPVPQDELKEVVQKALLKIKMERPLAIERFWLDLLNQSIPSMQHAIRKAITEKSIPLPITSTFQPILIGIQHWEKKLCLREESILRYALQKTAEEILLPQARKGQVVHIKNGLILVVFETEPNSILDGEVLKKSCEAYIEACHQYFYCQLSCYIGKEVEIHHMLDMYEKLVDLNQNNVASSKRVVIYSEQSQMNPNIPKPEMYIWAEMLKQGDTKKLQTEILHMLDSWKQHDHLDARSIKQFYQGFLQMILSTLQHNGLMADQILTEQLSPDRALLATRSVLDLQSWVQEVLEISMAQMQNKDLNQSIVERIKAYITGSIDQPLSRQYIADYIGLSPDYIVKLFKKETGLSISDYILGERIRMAKELLAQSDLSVSNIALAVGYTNFGYFSTTFKKEVSMTPQDYRNSIR